MLAKLRSMSVIGIDTFEIGIEADISETPLVFASLIGYIITHIG
jgi:hypothetical protein